MRTPEEAKDLLCPFARTFAQKEAVAGCRGPECALWRWEAIATTHPLWAPAVKARGIRDRREAALFASVKVGCGEPGRPWHGPDQGLLRCRGQS